LSFFYYFTAVVGIDNIYLLFIFFFTFIMISGIFITKLGVDPLEEYVKNLQALSKETLHELNLPISTIMTNTQMLRKNSSDEKSLKRIERIDRACDMLKERYNELDYLIKMQSREDVKEFFFIDALVKERVAFLSKIYPHIHILLSLESLEILGDKKGLAKVIDNIVDNGVKYSKDSTKIEISLQNATLSIKDYGIGMDEVELVQIFDTYYQSNKDIDGFGIGLSMVKRYCDKNKIELMIISKPELGTTLKLKFKNI